MTVSRSFAGEPARPASGDHGPVPPEPRRRHGGRTALIVVGIVVVVLVVLAVVADFAARSYAEGRAEKQIEQNLPAGTTGRITVKINGFSVLLQALRGTLSDVTLSSSNLVTSGVPLEVNADVKDVPLKSGGETGAVDATVVLDQAALNRSAILTKVSGTVTLKSGALAYASSIDLLGLKIGYDVTVKPSLAQAGKELVLTPTAASITGSNSFVDVSTLLGYLKTNPPTVCIAQSLPKGSSVTRIDISSSAVTLHLHNTGLPLDESGLTTKGSCS